MVPPTGGQPPERPAGLVGQPNLVWIWGLSRPWTFSQVWGHRRIFVGFTGPSQYWSFVMLRHSSCGQDAPSGRMPEP